MYIESLAGFKNCLNFNKMVFLVKNEGENIGWGYVRKVTI